jgi:hypothetical protein
MDRKNKKSSQDTVSQDTINKEVFEEALLYDINVDSLEPEVQYGRDHDERWAAHANRQSSHPHECKGPECEDTSKEEL